MVSKSFDFNFEENIINNIFNNNIYTILLAKLLN